MSDSPRLRVSELLREAELTGDKYLIVEGPTDRIFYGRWIAKLPGTGTPSVKVVSVDTIDVPSDDLHMAGLSDGNRSRVMLLSTYVDRSKTDVICIADRDCGHNTASYISDAMLWTDFPALESYAFDADVLDWLNAMILGGLLPAAASMMTSLTGVFLDLFTVRLHNEDLPAPNIARGFPSSKDPSAFDVAKTVHSSLSAAVPLYARPSFSDPREVVYGHDIAEVMMCVFGNVIKNKSAISGTLSLERVLRAGLLSDGSLHKTPMFQTLAIWSAPATV